MEPLFGRLANDMRQTLHHVIGLLELTAEEPLSPSQRDYLSRCRSSADQLLRTAADASELASFERWAPVTATLGVANAVEEVIGVMRVLTDRKGVELSWSLDSNVPERVVSSRDLIQDTLRRLLDNSIRFTDRGTIVLSVKARGIEEHSTVLIFEISDTGPGMPAVVLAAHCDPARVSLSEGGLGLPLVRKRLSDAGGQFAIVSSTSEGTTVRMSLPVSRVEDEGESPASHPRDAATVPEASSPLKLLVVEDSDESFALFKAYVKGQGHRVSRAFNGALGVEMVKSGDYDLVVMDVNMPVMDGYTATRTIREWETESGHMRIPILLLSAEDLARQMRLGTPVGCSGYISKPARKSEVLKALNYFAKR